MSKKVLKLAGRRPMLLALIVMATLTLGLLFSGWLTPTPTHAQQGGGGGGSNNENTGCPNYTTNVSASCPSITNNGAINTNSFCFPVGSSVPMPTLTSQPGASSGQQIITVTETCSNTVTSTTNAITESFSGLQYNPAAPSGSIVGTFTSDCYITATPSDTNDCSAQTIDYGNVTWHVLGCTNDNYLEGGAGSIVNAVLGQLQGDFSLGVVTFQTTIGTPTASRSICTCCTGETSATTFSVSGDMKGSFDLLAELGIPAIHFSWKKLGIPTPLGYYNVYVTGDGGCEATADLAATITGTLTNDTCNGDNISCQDYNVNGTLALGGNLGASGTIKYGKMFAPGTTYSFNLNVASLSISGSAGLNYNSCATPSWSISSQPCLNPATGSASFGIPSVLTLNGAASINVIPSIACTPVVPNSLTIFVHIIGLGDYNLYTL